MDKNKTRIILSLNGLPITDHGTLKVELIHENGNDILMSSLIQIKMPEKPQIIQRNA